MSVLEVEADDRSCGGCGLSDTLLDNNRLWSQRNSGAGASVFRDEPPAAPDILWIGCSGNHVPPHETVGLEPGDLFVHRNLGSLAPVHDLGFRSALEHALLSLRVRHVILVGHYGCTAVRQAMEGATSGLTRHWLSSVHELYLMEKASLDAISDPGRRLDRLCELNVIRQVRCIAQTPAVADYWKKGGRLTLHGWIYSGRSGLIGELMAPLERRPL